MMSTQKKKEIAVPLRLITTMFLLTLFFCLAIETEADRFGSRYFFYLFVASWQLIFGSLALVKIKRPTFFYFFSTLFLLPLALTCVVLSYLILRPFIASNQTLAISLMLIGTFLNFYLSFFGFGQVFMETLEQNIASGRFDLNKGAFAFSIPPKMLDYKNPKMKKVSNFLMINLGVVLFIGPIISFYISKSSDMNLKDAFGGIVCYFMSMVIGWAITGSFYNYLWMRGKEKEIGRPLVTRNV
jgi:hypothetical protein